MYKVIVAVVASLFVVGSAAAAYNLEPLTDQQKAEMRARAERLVAEQDARSMHTTMHSMHEARTHHVRHHDQRHKATTAH